MIASALHLLEQEEARASYRGMLAELAASGDLEALDGTLGDGLPHEPDDGWWK